MSEDQSALAARIMEGLAEARSVARGEADAPAHLSFTHEPTGHRVRVTGDFKSIEIVRDLLLRAATP
jgi:hypothetical protein